VFEWMGYGPLSSRSPRIPRVIPKPVLEVLMHLEEGYNGIHSGESLRNCGMVDIRGPVGFDAFTY
jgi:hypothetical protein